MGEPDLLAAGQSRLRLWAALAVEGALAADTVDVQRHQYEWRRMLKYDIDVRQVHWELSGRGGRELLVVLRKEAGGSWGADELFIPIGAGAAAEEAWEDVGEAEAEEDAAPDTGSALVPVNSDLGELTETPDAEVVPESASGDALLGQAIPLETRLFLEVF